MPATPRQPGSEYFCGIWQMQEKNNCGKFDKNVDVIRNSEIHINAYLYVWYILYLYWNEFWNIEYRWDLPQWVMYDDPRLEQLVLDTMAQCRIYPMGRMALHKKKGLHNETKDEKNVCYRKWKLLLLHLIRVTCHNIFGPNRYTYFSQARTQRGGAGGLRPSREKSGYTTSVYFGTVFRPNTPSFRSSLRSPERGSSC